jgi:CHAD domain-containing protein
MAARDPIYGVNRRMSRDALEARLCRAHGLQPAGTRIFERAHFDTFDRSLYHAGLVLEADRDERGYALSVRALGGATVVASGRAAAPPRFSAELPPAHLRRVLEPIVEDRALLEWLRLRVRSDAFRLPGAEDKTLANVVVESATALPNGHGNGVRLGPRVRVQAIKGYRRAADGLLRRLDTEPSLAADCDDPLVVGIALAGSRYPPEYTTRPAVELLPEMSSRAALGAVLRAYHSVMRANEAGVIDRVDLEFLHDFRTAMRRSRSLLLSVHGVVPQPKFRQFRLDFAWLSGVTGPLRDLDVFAAHLAAARSPAEAGLAAALAALRGWLDGRREAEHRKICDALRSQRYARLSRSWAATLSAMAADRLGGHSGRVPIIDAARAALERLYQGALRKGHAARSGWSMTELHELRKHCKKLRYVLEAFTSLFPEGAIENVIAPLKGLQDQLGRRCDHDAQRRLVEAWIAESPDCDRDRAARLRRWLDAAHSPTLGKSEFDKAFQRLERAVDRKRRRVLTGAG